MTQISAPEVEPRTTEATTAARGIRRIRILVVDDSVVIRRFLSKVLGEEPGFEVVGVAANGALALQRAAELKPDVITLDIEMPEMDGLTTLRRLREQSSRAYVIMCSTLTSRGALSTVNALILGANDYVTKPSGGGSIETALQGLRDQLIPKIKQFFEFRPLAAPQAKVAVPVTAREAIRPPAVTSRIAAGERKILAIGVSTGGPTALMEILPRLPGTLGVPVVIVQHMPPIFTKQLADRLNQESELEVLEAEEGLEILPGRAVIAAGDYHMRLRRAGNQVSVMLDQGPRENSCRPAVDALFRSVADIYSGASVGLILTGMGQDGLRGVQQLKGRGAYIVAQDRESSVVWGMPGAVVEAGLADAVVSLQSVAPEILRQVSR